MGYVSFREGIIQILHLSSSFLGFDSFRGEGFDPQCKKTPPEKFDRRPVGHFLQLPSVILLRCFQLILNGVNMLNETRHFCKKLPAC